MLPSWRRSLGRRRREGARTGIGGRARRASVAARQGRNRGAPAARFHSEVLRKKGDEGQVEVDEIASHAERYTHRTSSSHPCNQHTFFIRTTRRCKITRDAKHHAMCSAVLRCAPLCSAVLRCADERGFVYYIFTVCNQAPSASFLPHRRLAPTPGGCNGFSLFGVVHLLHPSPYHRLRVDHTYSK